VKSRSSEYKHLRQHRVGRRFRVQPSRTLLPMPRFETKVPMIGFTQVDEMRDTLPLALLRATLRCG
jgi:hypothetical protein